MSITKKQGLLTFLLIVVVCVLRAAWPATIGLPDGQSVEVRDIHDIADRNFQALAQNVAALPNLDTTAHYSRPCDYYVSSQFGDDKNTGTQAAPFCTIAKLVSMDLSGKTVGLVRGSTWRETLDVSAIATLAIEAVGNSTAPPLLDGSNVASNAAFVATSGQAGVYQINVTVAGGTSLMEVWENGTVLVHATSLANCQATAGTFWPASQGTTTPNNEGDSNGGALTLYVHPYGSTNPLSDGKLYEYAARQYGYIDSATCSIRGVWTRRNLCADGSMNIAGRATDCLFTDGSKHLAMLHQGGTMQNCRFGAGGTYWDGSTGSAIGNPLVIYNATADPLGLDTNVLGCTFDGGSNAVFGHSGSGTFSTINIEDCSAYNMSGTAWSVGAKMVNLKRCTSSSTTGVAAFGNINIEGCVMFIAYRGVDASGSSGATVRVHGCSITKTAVQADALIYATCAILDVQRNTLNHLNGFSISATAGTKTTMMNNDFIGNNIYAGAAADLVIADGNVFQWLLDHTDNGFGFQLNGSSGTVANYRAVTGFDQGQTNPGRTQVKTADFTIVAADCNNTYTTVGASGAVKATLPTAVIGLKYRFRVGAAQELRIDPAGSETIALPSTGIQGAAGKYLVADADGETVQVECTKAGQWSVFGSTGTWTAEP